MSAAVRLVALLAGLGLLFACSESPPDLVENMPGSEGTAVQVNLHAFELFYAADVRLLRDECERQGVEPPAVVTIALEREPGQPETLAMIPWAVASRSISARQLGPIPLRGFRPGQAIRVWVGVEVPEELDREKAREPVADGVARNQLEVDELAGTWTEITLRQVASPYDTLLKWVLIGNVAIVALGLWWKVFGLLLRPHPVMPSATKPPLPSSD